MHAHNATLWRDASLPLGRRATSAAGMLVAAAFFSALAAAAGWASVALYAASSCIMLQAWRQPARAVQPARLGWGVNPEPP